MFQQHVQSRPGQPPPPARAPVQAADVMTTRLAQLQQLGALRAQGILSDAEFEAQKRQILAGSA